LHTLANSQFGFVIISGQTGEGKSTSLAAIINEINLTRKAHVITIEDPVEFIYPAGQSLISQREVKKDTLSFNKALKSVLREDPDVVVIGEMRDYETISIALTLAETGHLVFSTLHTNTAAQTIDRIVDVFPEEQQSQIKSQLANVLRAIVCQKLLPRLNNEGRIVGYELLFNNSAVASLIREGKTFQIDNIIQTSADQNMILFENSLRSLVRYGFIKSETAVKYALRPKLMEELLI
jgi:twitching motility protein PilT